MTTPGSEVQRLNHLYAALSQINRAILRTSTRGELFSKVCATLVEHGGFCLAWIGWLDPESGGLLPAAHVGDESGYLQTIETYADGRTEGRGPTGTAFREGRPYICNDMFEDQATSMWRAELERRGLCASAAFPIHLGGEVRGTLSVYADRRGIFRHKEIALLSEAASDISFALDNMARNEARQRSEEIVKRFAAIVESTDDAVFSRTLEGTITSWNRGAENMFGYRAEEIQGRSIELLMPGDRGEEVRLWERRIRSGHRVEPFETLGARQDGTLFPVSITASPIWGPDPQKTGATTIVGVSKIVRDITLRKQAEAVAQTEQRFATGLIEAMPGIFYLYDASGRFLRWNHNFEKVTGYSAEEISTLHPLDLFGPKDRPLVQQRIEQVFEHGEATVEAPLVAKNGTVIPYFFTGKHIVEGEESRLIGVGVDIALRKRAEEAVRKSEERYRTTLDTILEGCQIIGLDWRYLYLNPAAAIQNRRPNAELLGNRMPEMWPGIEGTELFRHLRRCMEARVSTHAEVEFTFTHGASGWFDVRAQPVPEGIFVLSIDITERVKAEKAVRELNENLEKKVAERTLDLEVARERAEAADRIKSAFLATMSHELRTPLNSILGFTGIVLKEMAGPLNPEQSKQLGMVQTSARHLLDLINDVLDISKIEAGQLEVHCAPFDLRASIEQVAASVAPLVEKKGLALKVVLPDLLEPLESDRRRVEQILLNLLNNAIKFTDQGTITLTVDEVVGSPSGTQAKVQKLARILVRDTGIGMKAEDITKLFRPFQQLDSGLQRQHEGTGLGLAICRRLTELLGGSISVESVWGAGSAFTVVLPTKRTGPS